jgi:hypothetical protein
VDWGWKTASLATRELLQELSIAPTQNYQEDAIIRRIRAQGLCKILQLLHGCDQPLVDRRAFLKGDIIFGLWVQPAGTRKTSALFFGLSVASN